MTKTLPANPYNILLVEDEDSLREALKLNLSLEKYMVTAVGSGKDALKAFKEEYFDCIILDIMIPDMDGLQVCESIRLQNDLVPILFLSAKSASADRVLGLKKGGDDYLTKPFNLEELLLRVEKLINKNQRIEHSGEQVSEFTIGDSKIDFLSQECSDTKGNKHSLTKKEVMFLKLLVENKNEVITREYILKMVWGYNVFPTTRTIDNFITTFRKYFEPDAKQPQYFISVRGVGYKLVI
ncbi:MAG: response regulator transcription factor [Chitinophagaceae bacterium]|nr:response regulator transcription factor [Chitinophagaceae bacterium]